MDEKAKKVADGLSGLGKGVIDAFKHLDTCIHDLREDMTGLKKEVTDLRNDFTRHRSDVNQALEITNTSLKVVLERLPK